MNNNKNAPFDFKELIHHIPDRKKALWRKKNAATISICSVLGIGGIITAIAVPLVLFTGDSKNNTIVVPVAPTPSNVAIKNVFNIVDKTVRLFVSGNELPKKIDDYKVFNITNPTNKIEIDSNITIAYEPNKPNYPILKFLDKNLVANSKYELAIYKNKPGEYIIQTEINIPQPEVKILIEPVNQTLLDVVTKTNISFDAIVFNQLGDKVTPTYQWYTSNTDTQQSVWEKIPNATSGSYEYFLGNQPTSSKKYFKCLLDYEYVETVSTKVIYIEKTTATQAEKEKVAIATFNAKPIAQKISFYNDVVTNNNDIIKDYILKEHGMFNFFDANVAPVISGNSLDAYTKFREFLRTYNAYVSGRPAPVLNSSVDFLKMKGVYSETETGENLTFVANYNETSKYLTQVLTSFDPSWIYYDFYSPVVESISNIQMQSDFSLQVNLNTRSDGSNFSYFITDGMGARHYLHYKDLLEFNNSTIFPGMTEYIKTNILKSTNY
ncbi:MAG: hypothetical protein RSA87_03570 [Malacoplasma sp.]